MSIIKKVITGTKSEKSRRAKSNLLKFAKKANKHLKAFFKEELSNPFGVSSSEKQLTRHLLSHIKKHNLNPAKRLRASLVYYGYLLFNNENKDKVLSAAMSVELVHTALLIHDDFMDQDSTRRGFPTTHKVYEEFHRENRFRGDPVHYGEAMATDLGDTALCLGFEILGESDFPAKRRLNALNRLFRGVVNTTYGQAFDIYLEELGKASEEDIINLHKAKSAIYTYENPLHVGAVLAGAEDDDLKLLTEYATPAGVAFQLQDDILGLFGDPRKTGKPAHSDLRQGKMTLLIIKALEKGTNGQKKVIIDHWGKLDLTDEEAEKVRQIVIDTGSLEYSKNISREWASKAQLSIPQMKTRGWDKEAIDYLDGIAQYMIEREI